MWRSSDVPGPLPRQTGCHDPLSHRRALGIPSTTQLSTDRSYEISPHITMLGLGLHILEIRLRFIWIWFSVYGKELRDFEVYIDPPLLPLLIILGSLEFSLNRAVSLPRIIQH
jgi:hypothetical protein